MRILSIESSCDETSAAVVEKKNQEIKVLSNVTATSLNIHSKTGGIIPENAAREQVKFIMPVIIEALLKFDEAIEGDKRRGTLIERPQANESERGRRMGEERSQDPQKIMSNEILKNSIDTIAVTYGPGLIGSLLVGVETAKTLAYVFDKPLIPVNHLLAHIYANFIDSNIQGQRSNIQFPFIGLIVSGGHTDLLLFKEHGEYKWLGGTRDDAAGEAFDKIGRILGLSYPAGPEIERRASLVEKTDIKFKSPLINSDDFDFSFSGLKTEAARYIQKMTTNAGGERKGNPVERPQMESRTSNGKGARQDPQLPEDLINQICYATQKAIIDVLVKKTLKAAEKYNCKNILVGGGVSANQTLINQFKLSILNSQLSISLFAPQKEYCTDNGAMIGSYALLNPVAKNWQEVTANPELYFA